MPRWTTRPRSMTPTRSPSSAASVKSWVTSSAGTPASREHGGQLAAGARRACAGRAPTSGSSSSSAAGRRASARASATRWRSPPDSVRGPRVGEVARRRSARAARARAGARSPRGDAAQRVGDVLPGAQVARTARSPGRRSRSAAARARRRCRARCRARPPRRRPRGPRRGRSEPGDDAQDRASCRRPTGPASARQPPAGDLERDVEVERPEPRARPQRAAPPSQAEPLSSLTASSSAAETRDQHGRERERAGEVGREALVDRQRHGLGDAAERAGEHQRRAELAQRAAPGEREPGDQARRRRRGSRSRANVRASPAPSVREASSQRRGRAPRTPPAPGAGRTARRRTSARRPRRRS